MNKILHGSWSIACVCMVLGFMLAVQFRTTQVINESVPHQRIEEMSARLLQTEEERDDLKEELEKVRKEGAGVPTTAELRLRAGVTPLEGEGVIVKIDDSSASSKSGENPNLYLVHDDDLLRVINELRAAGAEAVSVNGQRLIGTSEIRCAGPTLSVNNVRSAPPFIIHAIGDKKALEGAIKMRGGVAETLKVWGILVEVKAEDKVYVPAYKGTTRHTYASETTEKEAEVR